MKHLQLVATFVLATGWALPDPAGAQSLPTVPFARGDASGSIGWLNANKSGLSGLGSNDWSNSGLYGSGEFGWYWTDHHKLEVEAAASRSGRFYSYEQVQVGSNLTYRTSEYRFVTGRVAVSERYQFRRNAWFHPHVGAGLELVRETTEEHEDPVFIFDQVTRQTRTVQPETETREPDVHVRGFAELGFKAYMSPRSFFRTDVRFAVGGRLEDVLFRFGFGVDF